MRLLYVLKHDPWGIGGGCYACRNYLQLFTEVFANSEIDACICEEYLKGACTEDYPNVHFIPVKQRSILGKVMTPITGLLHRHYNMVKALLHKNHYDYCIFDHNSIAGSLVEVCHLKGLKTIVLNHNCEYDYFRDNNGVLKRHFFLHQVRRNERNSYRKCDFNFFLTEEDMVQFELMYGESETKSIVGGCFYPKGYQMPDVSTVKPLRKEHLKLVISGTMGNVQNLDGINYFLDDLLPFVPDDMQIVLAGKNPPASLVERVSGMAPRITLIPNPKDMDEVVRDCDIFLCPARLGGGMKLRMMDGFRNGLPVLAHAVSARGYRKFERKGMMWEFKTAEEFGKELNEVFDGIQHGEITKNDIMQESSRYFNFENMVDKTKQILKKHS